MRVYLVIVDESAESGVALRFASVRAARTGGTLHLLALIERQPFVAFAGVQATISAEARSRAEALVNAAASGLMLQDAAAPVVAVREGEALEVVRDYLGEHPEVSALVLGAAASGNPGPLVSHFTAIAGQLRCPVYVVPGSLDAADLDRLG